MRYSIATCSNCPWWRPFFVLDTRAPWEHLLGSHGELTPGREQIDQAMENVPPIEEYLAEAASRSKELVAEKLNHAESTSRAPSLNVVNELGREEKSA